MKYIQKQAEPLELIQTSSGKFNPFWSTIRDLFQGD
jgi:hypothetical protein